MATVKTYQCDECGELKKLTNRWWLVMISDDPELVLIPWDSSLADAGWRHVCGEQCAQKAVARYMNSAKK